MIPSKYLFPIIALVLVWAGSLVGVYSYATAPEAPEAPLDFHQHLYDQLATRLTDYQQHALVKFEGSLADDAKARFRPLLHPINENQRLMDRFEQRSKDFKRMVSASAFNSGLARHCLRSLAKEATNIALEMAANHTSLLRRQGEEFDLHKDNIATINEAYFENALAVDAKDLLIDSPTYYPDFKLRAQAIRLMLVQYQSYLDLETMKIAGGIVLRCFVEYDYPMLVQPNAVAAKGEKLVLPIGVGKVDFSRAPEDVSFIIDGQPYPMGPRGLLQYEAPTEKRGLNTIPVTLLIRNPVTGFVRATESEISYLVR